MIFCVTDMNDFPEWARDVSIDYTKVEFGDSYSQRVIDPLISEQFDNKLASLWHTGKYGFPGSLAVSVLRSDFEAFKNNQYHILPKSDGTRYILHAFTNDSSDPIVDMFERAGCHHIISASFIKRVFQGTILDGELIKTKTGKCEYQVFDCIASCGILMVDRLYSERLVEAHRLISKYYRYSPNDPFMITAKEPLTPSKARLCMALDSTDEEYPLQYPIDGLILVSETAPYQSGRDQGLFKYKKTEDHTVDFHTRIWEKKEFLKSSTWMCDLHIIDNGKRQCVQTFSLEPKHLETLGVDSPSLLNNAILECVWSLQTQRWEPRKQRFDKQIPNNLKTLNLTCQNINENISIKELLSLFPERSQSIRA